MNCGCVMRYVIQTSLVIHEGNTKEISTMTGILIRIFKLDKTLLFVLNITKRNGPRFGVLHGVAE